jgi:hypothetical protein
MVVLLVNKYLNFLVRGGIILFFLHLDFVGFLVLPVLSGCTAASSINSSKHQAVSTGERFCGDSFVRSDVRRELSLGESAH